MQSVKPRRDPAPSRLRYRAQRLWLTPSFRRLLRVGPPVLVVGLLALYLATDAEIRQQFDARVADFRQQLENQESFLVDAIQISGTSADLRQEVLARVDVPIPLSSLNIDVAELRALVMEIPSVATASVRVVAGGILHIEVRERQPAALWRDISGLNIVDRDGVVLGAAATRLGHAGLPLILGKDAAKRMDEALELFQIAQPLHARMRGLQRVGGRRWNLVLDRGLAIMLPEFGAAQALRRVLGLHAADDLLGRDVVAVDMRDGARPILRLSDFAMTEIRRLQAMERGELE